MKQTFILILSLSSLCFGFSFAEASWFIDAGKFHISAHGRTSCQDCHDNIAGEDLHPNPSDVRKEVTDFFTVEKCLSCHDDVMDNIEEGFHGAEKVKDPDTYSRCIRCHNPHYQMNAADSRSGTFEPDRPPHEQCGVCHQTRTDLPEAEPEDRDCFACHVQTALESPENKAMIEGLCFHCHADKGTQARKMTREWVPLINVKEYDETPHAGMACTVCHPEAPAFNHHHQEPGDCRQCHLPHDEKVARDLHAAVACEACHLKGIKPIRDPQSKRVLWERLRETKEPTKIHQMAHTEGETACMKCHFKGNQVGAVSMILPSKSILCMPCHAATFSVGDTITIIALIFLAGGLILTLSVWLTGSLGEERITNPFLKFFKLLIYVARAVFSTKILSIIKAIFLDVLLQRRLFRQSRTRWLIHSLIFLPFVFRFSWGIAALIASLWTPEWEPVWAMLNKNYPATALFFDLSGVMILLGVTLAFIRGILERPNQMKGIPNQDRFALGLIAGIVVIGFVLEGMRIAMTGYPEGSGYAIIGYWISLLFSSNPGLTESYGYIWYVHAVLTGAFFAYLPFSRLLHIILAPFVLALNVFAGHANGK